MTRFGFGFGPGHVSRRVSAGSFSPLQLFASGENGAWYDPSDLSTMFQTSLGNPDAVVGQPVGLILDKRLGLALGAETLTNPDFDTGGTGWTSSSWSFSGGLANVSSAAATQIFQSPAITGKYVEITFVVTSITAGRIRPRVGNIYGNYVDAPGTYTFRRWAESNTAGLWTEGAATASIGSISVKVILGNHLRQATSANRPVLRQSAAGAYYLECSGTQWLAAAFTLAQPVDRVAGIRHITRTAGDVIFGGSAAAAAQLIQSGTDAIGISNSADAVTGPTTLSPPVGVDFVTTERHYGATSRVTVNRNTYSTGSAGTTGPGGLTIGADNAGANGSNVRVYGVLEIGRELTDTETAGLQTYMASKCSDVELDPIEADLFAIAGQSNAEGRGTSASSPAVAAGTAYLFNGTSLAPLADPVGGASTGSAWPAFAKAYYAATGRVPIFVEVATGGSSLIQAADLGAGYWDVAGASTLYTAAKNALIAARDYLAVGNYSIGTVNVLWAQGESDGDGVNGTTITGSIYEGLLDDLVSAFDADVGIDRFIISKLGLRNDGTKLAEYAEIAAAQAAVAASNAKVVMGFEGAADFVAAGKMKDTYHYNQTGLNEMGAAMAAASAV